jgi:4-hydroxyphenylacetate 3-monooxygenase
LVISGAKVVATGSPHTQYLFISHTGAPVREKKFALAFICPTNGPGVKMYCRSSYEYNAAVATGPFDNPLSSRCDENDAVLVLDKTLIPWENVIVYDVDTINNLEYGTAWEGRALMQASTRMSVKMDFLVGALSKALDITGAGQFRGVEASLGEVISWRNALTAIRDGMIENGEPGPGDTFVPSKAYGRAYAALAPQLYSRVRHLMESVIASGLIYLNSHAVDLQNPEIAPDLERYLRGSDGRTVYDRSKTMKLLWDAIGSEFGARHELYELNYFGQPEVSHLQGLVNARQSGYLDHTRAIVEACMSEYDLTGWTSPDLINPNDVTTIKRAK